MQEEERTDEVLDSSPEEEIVESSTTEEEQVVDSEPTEEQGTTEENRVPYDRFKEVNDEKNYWRQQAERLSTPVQQPQVEADPYAQFQDPQTKLFYQEMDKRMVKLAKKIAEEEKAPILRQNEILTGQLAQIQHKMFKTDNTDVVEGSQEEARIAQLISSGIPIQEATWAVMGPKRVARAQGAKQQKVNKKVEMKQKANLATSSAVAPQSGLPPQEVKSFKEKMAERMDKEWNEQLS
jgi:hypothetical protein